MSYYFTKAYNYYYDIHPNRPTEKDIRQKWNLTEQIKKNNYKFKNQPKQIIIEKKDSKPINYESLRDSMKILNLMKNKKKEKCIQNVIL
jgi:hypothetical protein